MKVEMERNAIRLVPESERDVAFIEDTLGLFEGGNRTELVRHNDVQEKSRYGFDLRAAAKKQGG